MNKVRIKDIAACLGISSSTVSRALDGNPRISEKTRNAVMEKARELGYDHLSVIRVSRRTEPIHIAVLCPYDIYFETVVAGMKAALEELNVDNIHIEYRFFDIYDVVEQTKQLPRDCRRRLL